MRTVAPVLVSVAIAACAQAGPSVVADPALAGFEQRDWTALYLRAAELRGQGKIDEAAVAFYAGQYRARVLVQCLRPREDGAPALLASMNATVGEATNREIGRSVKRWVAAIDSALAWTDAHPDPATSGVNCASVRISQRAGLVSLRDGIAADPAANRAARAENGLPNDAE